MPHCLVREHLLTALLESPENGVLSVARDGTVETWSPGAECIYGYTAQEMIGQRLNRVDPLHQQPELELAFSEAGGDELTCFETTERRHKDGSKLFLKVKRVLIRDEAGEVRRILESARTLNSCEWAPAREAPLQSVVEQMPGFFWTTDRNLQITSNWGKGMASANLLPGMLVGRSVLEFLGCADRHLSPTAEHCDALRGVSSRFECNWNDLFLEIQLEPLRAASGEIRGCLALAMDITNRKKIEERALYLASHDALTGLANYRDFMDRLEREVNRAERSHHYFTLLLLDLDGLKRINDLQGHLTGNRALQRLAAVMAEQSRSTDVAARHGGDEFAVILIDSDRGMAEQVARRIEYGLRTDRVKPALSVSIGMGVYPDDGRTAAELFEAADQQLYKNKRGENRRKAMPPLRSPQSKRAAH